ncbi:MAG: Sapep family Mn(2+)-dependent dipeptidase [Oscillospiraceae bacterium]|nr:Sapep family Mn(2+)-dependent dipeptidase [Oscillospiraceae bacterium]
MCETMIEIRAQISMMQEELLENLKKLVVFDSVESPALPGKPFGENVHAALEFVLALARSMGFRAENLEGYVGVVDWGEGEELIGVLCHVDIVPVGNLSSWNTPPLALTEIDGYVYGRGTADDKGPLLSVLYGMYALKKLGYIPKKRIRIIIGTNEETNWGCMRYYKEHCEIPSESFSPDGMFTVVNREKGVCGMVYSKQIVSDGIIIKGGTARNVVADNCSLILPPRFAMQKSALQTAIEAVSENATCAYTLDTTSNNALTVTCIGKSAPAHTPQPGANAIIGILKLAADCSFMPTMQKEASALLRQIGDTPDGTAMGIDCSDEESGPLTMNLGVLSLHDETLTFELDIRIPVTIPLAEKIETVHATFLTEGYTQEYCEEKEPLFVPDSLPLIQSLCRVYEMVHGEKAQLWSIGGGTYARAFDNCVCFGACYPGESLNIHMANERALVENLFKNAMMYGMALKELTLPSSI